DEKVEEDPGHRVRTIGSILIGLLVGIFVLAVILSGPPKLAHSPSVSNNGGANGVALDPNANDGSASAGMPGDPLGATPGHDDGQNSAVTGAVQGAASGNDAGA